ncbi:thiamine phosphate synthase [Shewanella fidelis]|uniref:Thiamine-phosphate synthase n=1 Tax=Shewanella fidelis TaxID=173509 RepID=A0AAW8NLE3_9GAMM|nr:thiamine phosphate synthase [Shewanella fidelis]MDR8524042.1 thiamine phosphate synthase [Shewanella fidelis]MDW4810589.1 thiamine phosphate synthase [Shewanella fidelis]MDW4814710.1 thiamine phosphate synthase [Shewanella fidelis]MDW4818800.1 thiamine phosphate synthase [Shewanella fidelis]MDW4823523.1 thiamine phosphate synthase [Shewanella fidelis]
MANPDALSVKRPIVWTIAGSDSGGGAGIQADLATMSDLDTHACSVITAVTAQSSVTVALVESVSSKMLLSQLDTLASDLPPAAIKIGLLANQSQIDLLANWLAKQRTNWLQLGIKVPVILDPVMVATCGDALATGAGLDFSPFKGLLTLITPNVSELAVLAATELSSVEACILAAKNLSETLSTSVLAKGGDNGPAWCQQQANDLLVCVGVDGISDKHQWQSFWLSSKRVETANNHGTGCTLSSAIAAVMAHGFVLNDAVVVAKAYVNAGLKASYQVGLGPGCLARTAWPQDLGEFPHVKMVSTSEPKPVLLETSQAKASDKGFKRIDEALGLYPVVADLDILETLLKAGAKTIQLRIKDPNAADLEQSIIQAISLGRDYQARVFINDHWQLAIKHQAYGVHLGQEDLIASNLAQLQSANLALGLSSHSYFEILLANQHQPSYIAFGHIFPTTTKVMPSKPQGLAKLARYVSLMKGELPIVAIGGIDATTLASVKATLVDDVAVVRALTQATDPQAAFKALNKAWQAEV